MTSSDAPVTVEPGGWGEKYDGIDEFRSKMNAKLALGDLKYGPDSWQRHDQLAEAMEELVDLGNYAFLKWRQLKALQDRLALADVPRSLTGENRLGVQPVEEHEHRPDEFAVCPQCREFGRQATGAS